MKKRCMILCSLMCLLVLTACGKAASGSASSWVESSSSQPPAQSTPDAPSPSEPAPVQSDPVQPAVSAQPGDASPDGGGSQSEPVDLPEKTEVTPEIKSDPKPAVVAPKPAEQPKPAADPEPQPDSDPEPEPAPEQPAATRETASAYIGRSVSSLIAAIGSPNGSDYAPSCLGDGEDGELFYDGFTVYTYRVNGTETVQDVV